VIAQVEVGSSAQAAGLRLGFVIKSIDSTPVEQIIAEAQADLAPPYNEQGCIDILTCSLIGLIYGDPGTCVTLAYLGTNAEPHEECIERI
jgi:hypothetical protein